MKKSVSVLDKTEIIIKTAREEKKQKETQNRFEAINFRKIYKKFEMN